jgi:tetratricopeptide (TPR) repeat protein
MKIKKITIGIAIVLLLMSTTSCGKKSVTSQGIASYEAGNYQAAIEYFQAGISQNSTEVDNYVYLGMAYLELEDYENAKKTFLLGKNLSSSEKMLIRGLGLVAYYEEDYEKAIEYFNQVLNSSSISIGKTECDILRYRAKAQTALEQYEDAVDSYSTLLKVQEEDSELYYDRGCLWLKLDKVEEAQEDYKKAIELENSGYTLYWNIYQQLSNANYQAQADEYIDLALELPVSGDSSYRYRAFFLYLKEDYENAIKEFSKISELDTQALVYLADSYLQCNEEKKAENVFKNAIEDNSSNLELYNQYALFLIKEGKAKEALEWLNKGLSLDSADDTREIEYNLIVVYEQLLDYESAMDMLELYEATYGTSDKLEKEREFLSTRLS